MCDSRLTGAATSLGVGANGGAVISGEGLSVDKHLAAEEAVAKEDVVVLVLRHWRRRRGGLGVWCLSLCGNEEGFSPKWWCRAEEKQARRAWAGRVQGGS